MSGTYVNVHVNIILKALALVAGGDIIISYVHQKCNEHYATGIASVRDTQKHAKYI